MSANIGEYYREWKPKKYVRTYQFLNSLDKIDVTKMGNAYFSQVKINYEDMHYIYDYGDEITFEENGWDVIVAANRGEHGVETVKYTSDHCFWDDALDTVYYTYIKEDFEKWISNDTGCKCFMK